MLFNSYIFILLFLPLAVIGYFFLNKFNNKFAQVYLLGMSLWFYGYNVPSYLLIIISSILINYTISKLLVRLENQSYRKLLLWIGILFNIGIIGYYKYFNFIEWNINYFLKTDFVIKSIILPLGISFYTIQQISFLLDSYNDKELNYGFLEYALFVTFFPQLVAGPIVYHVELIPQFRDKAKQKADAENILTGIQWFTLGLSKKVFFADCLGNGVNWALSNVDALNCLDVLLISMAYTLQLYNDFSGYSDMACGIAKMFNFDLPQNFNSPLKSLSLRDYWKRWHMTLTRFFTKYVYIPLGGSRKGKLRKAINILIVFTVSGIWHGANYTYMGWGLLDGIGIIISNKIKGFQEKLPKVVRWVCTICVMNFLHLLFRATGLKQWIALVKKMFDVSSVSMGVNGELLNNFDSYLPPYLLIIVALIVAVALPNNYVRKKSNGYLTIFGCAALLALCLTTLNRVSIFLYFNF